MTQMMPPTIDFRQRWNDSHDQEETWVMNYVKYICATLRDEILQQMAVKQTPVVLTRQGANGWVVAKSRFAGADVEQGWLSLEAPLAENEADEWAIPLAGELLGVSFRRGHKKYVFNALVCAPEVLQLPDKCRRQMIFVRWPENVQELQRRVYQRACPPPGRKIKVTIQTTEADSRMRTTISGILEDLSAGGMRVLCEHPVELERNVKLSFALRSRGDSFSLDGTFRHCQATDRGDYSVGFQFVGMETSPQGHELLHHIARVVTDFQRAAMRRRPRNLHRRSTPR